MEDSKRKSIMIGIVIVCLAVAGLVTYKTRPKRAGIESLRGRLMWVRCKKCSAEYQMDLADYLHFISENQTGPSAPPMACEECDTEKAYKALKCPNEKCGKVFIPRRNTGDLEDRCPHCSFSEKEERTRQKRSQKRSRSRSKD